VGCCLKKPYVIGVFSWLSYQWKVLQILELMLLESVLLSNIYADEGMWYDVVEVVLQHFARHRY
jgi:hypothetical protein